MTVIEPWVVPHALRQYERHRHKAENIGKKYKTFTDLIYAKRSGEEASTLNIIDFNAYFAIICATFIHHML